MTNGRSRRGHGLTDPSANAARAALVVGAVALFAAQGCRRPSTHSVLHQADAGASAPPLDGSVEGGVDAREVGPAPTPAPPALPIACTPDPNVRWSIELPAPDSYTSGQVSGPAAFACSPFRTSAAPFELTLAPGTMLRIPLGIEVNEGGAFAYVTEPRFLSAGLPKGAFIDPADQTLAWRVAGAEGDVLSFSVAAIATRLPGGKACVRADIIVRVRDDAGTRGAQAAALAVTESTPAAIEAYGGNASTPNPEVRTILDRVRCGAPPIEPRLLDADGDGLADALFLYPGGGGGAAPETAVWLRRKDTFVRIGRAVGTALQTADGATFLVDTVSASTAFACSLGIKIHQVMSNRLQLQVDEATQAPVDPDSGCLPGDGLHEDLDKGRFLGFTDQSTKAGATKRRVFRWNGKRFAPTP